MLKMAITLGFMCHLRCNIHGIRHNKLMNCWDSCDKSNKFTAEPKFLPTITFHVFLRVWRMMVINSDEWTLQISNHTRAYHPMQYGSKQPHHVLWHKKNANEHESEIEVEMEITCLRLSWNKSTLKIHQKHFQSESQLLFAALLAASTLAHQHPTSPSNDTQQQHFLGELMKCNHHIEFIIFWSFLQPYLPSSKQFWTSKQIFWLNRSW